MNNRSSDHAQTPSSSIPPVRHGVTPAQIAIAWLLGRSPMVLPIPGTRSLEHLEENWAARRILLSPDEMADIARPPAAP